MYIRPHDISRARRKLESYKLYDILCLSLHKLKQEKHTRCAPYASYKGAGKISERSNITWGKIQCSSYRDEMLGNPFES